MWTVTECADRGPADRGARRRDHGHRVQPLPPAGAGEFPLGARADDDPLLRRAVTTQLAAYFARDLKEFDLPLAPRGQCLPAAGLGAAARRSATARPRRTARSRTGSARPTPPRVPSGLANGRNPIPIVIPCHRVIGANGTLTGYAGGLARKQQLLGLEQDALF